MKKILLILILCTVSLSSAQNNLTGYKDYKFGMTLAEADSLYDDDSLVRWVDDDGNVTESSLKRNVIIYGEPFTVYACYDTINYKIYEITLDSELKENIDQANYCKAIIMQVLIDKYGNPDIKIDYISTWLFDNGRYIKMHNYETKEKNYYIHIIYGNSTGL